MKEKKGTSLLIFVVVLCACFWGIEMAPRLPATMFTQTGAVDVPPMKTSSSPDDRAMMGFEDAGLERSLLKKIEPPNHGSSLLFGSVWDSSKELDDCSILRAIGGEANATTELAAMYSLARIQSHGERGSLLNDGSINLFYVRDAGGITESVSVWWDSRRIDSSGTISNNWWFVASSIEPCVNHGSNTGIRVFMRSPIGIYID